MNNMKDIDKKIEKILKFGKNEYFIANRKFKCNFWKWQSMREDAFSKWKKDENSPEMFCEALLNVIDENTYNHLYGCIRISKDPNLSHKYFASLFIKHLDSKDWEHMYVITNLIA